VKENRRIKFRCKEKDGGGQGGKGELRGFFSKFLGYAAPPYSLPPTFYLAAVTLLSSEIISMCPLARHPLPCTHLESWPPALVLSSTGTAAALLKLTPAPSGPS